MVNFGLGKYLSVFCVLLFKWSKKFSKSEICETTVFQPKTLLSKVSRFSNTEMVKSSMKLPDFLCFGPQMSGPFVENVRASQNFKPVATL